MSERPPTDRERTPAERLAAIETRQQRLLDELDRLNGRIELAIADLVARPGDTPARAQAA